MTTTFFSFWNTPFWNTDLQYIGYPPRDIYTRNKRQVQCVAIQIQCWLTVKRSELKISETKPARTPSVKSRFCRGLWEFYKKRRAFARALRFRPDFTAVQFNELLDDGKPQAG